MTDRMTRNEDFGFTLRRFLLRSRGTRQAIALCDVEKGETRFHLGSHSSNLEDHIKTDSQVEKVTFSTSSATNQSILKGHSLNHQKMATSSNEKNIPVSSDNGSANDTDLVKCSLCLGEWSKEIFYPLISCDHLSCRHCLIQYLTIEISESRINIACPQCSVPMHPRDIHFLLIDYPVVYEKYEDFMVRRVLACDPDTRWCPAPDCSYAVVATGCASCPLLKCERPNCGSLFCYHCKAEWHPDQTCDAARITRNPLLIGALPSHDIYHRDDIKPCPRCKILIVKMDDGSCNHMMCAVCGAEFCWLCMKEITDLHYLSPSGCTFWGKKPWSRKKKLLWQLGTLVGAPIGIGLVAGIAIPAMIIGIPVWVGRKLYARYRPTGKHKRMGIITGGVLASIIISPVLAGLAVAIGVPILLFYVYGVVPVSLCRAGGCGVTTSATGVKFEFDEEDVVSRNQDSTSVDTASRIGGTSIGEVSLNFGGPTSSDIVQGSTVALAGSIISHRLEMQADLISETASAVTCLSEKSGQDAASTKALAGSILSYRHHGENEDCGSERVRFDDTISYIHGDPPDKTSLCSIMSLRDETDNTHTSGSKRCTFSRQSDDKPTIKPISKAAMLRNMFFQANMTEDKHNHH